MPSFLSREELSIFFPRRLASNCTYPRCQALSAVDSFFALLQKSQISPRCESNSKTKASSIRGLPLDYRGDRTSFTLLLLIVIVVADWLLCLFFFSRVVSRPSLIHSKSAFSFRFHLISYYCFLFLFLLVANSLVCFLLACILFHPLVRCGSLHYYSMQVDDGRNSWNFLAIKMKALYTTYRSREQTRQETAL